ncbi:MAG: T9SS type A sorting domain-containing protein [Bacteroidales bacterium]|nr:T9SS type A sorting domain-containing protein [Bacteroidales bacterium]
MKIKFLLAILSAGLLADIAAQNGVIIQENTVGVCTMDGIIETSATGYTGEGYANIDNGTGIGMSWSFTVDGTGNYLVYWRYALGGSDVTSRDAALLINNISTDSVRFPHSGSTSWAEWVCTDTFTIHLESGYNKIHLVSITEKGLPNLDYFHILDDEAVPVECVPSYHMTVSQNDTGAGTIDYTPKQFLYDYGTVVTVSATANAGYIFHSWSGEVADTSRVFSFEIRENTDLEALFYPAGTEGDPEAIGYATVQHDNGTPYLLTGGAPGTRVQANSLTELQNYLSSDLPLTVELGSHITGVNTDEIVISSNKTLIGINDSAHIEGIRTQINGSRNIIIKNITFSGVVRYDAFEINGGARNVWIDHCNFYSDRDHDKDYYDGLLDIKNQSTFLTVSWTRFHDHHKAILISSGDEEWGDTVIRITFHHDAFYNCGSRLPSLRFGKAHLFNNYYLNNGTSINTHMNACVRVENNYFDNAGTGVGSLYTEVPGGVQLIDNIFVNTGYSEEPICELDVPYPYESVMHPAEQVPDTVLAGIGINLNDGLEQSVRNNLLAIYPNPSDGQIIIMLDPTAGEIRQISVFSITGKHVFRTGSMPFNGSIDLSALDGGMYFLQVTSSNGIYRKAITIY